MVASRTSQTALKYLSKDFSIGLELLIDRTRKAAEEVGYRFPYFADESGIWITTSDGDWCGGHWVGMLWLAYRRTRDVFFRELALRLTRRLAERVSAADMFRGMIHYYSAAVGSDLTGNKQLANTAVRAAEGICAMYNPKARMIPLGSEVKIRGAAVSGNEKGAVDNAAVPLMVVWWAWKRTGRLEFAEVATVVTEQVCNWFIRPDGSTWQVGIFNPESGELVRRQTILGYSDESCWSRGQAWLLYGLANAYYYSRNSSFLDSFRRVWHYFQSRLPSDRVPYYDFSDPRIPGVPRDTSAASVAAAGLALLSEADEADLSEYRKWSEAIVASLLSRYCTEDGRLTQGCFNLPAQVATHNELVWGSYYLMETLDRLAGW
jgi:unsaturated chondroitin disaccharide hydrolase